MNISALYKDTYSLDRVFGPASTSLRQKVLKLPSLREAVVTLKYRYEGGKTQATVTVDLVRPATPNGGEQCRLPSLLCADLDPTDIESRRLLIAAVEAILEEPESSRLFEVFKPLVNRFERLHPVQLDSYYYIRSTDEAETAQSLADQMVQEELSQFFWEGQ